MDKLSVLYATQNLILKMSNLALPSLHFCLRHIGQITNCSFPSI